MREEWYDEREKEQDRERGERGMGLDRGETLERGKERERTMLVLLPNHKSDPG